MLQPCEKRYSIKFLNCIIPLSGLTARYVNNTGASHYEVPLFCCARWSVLQAISRPARSSPSTSSASTVSSSSGGASSASASDGSSSA